MKELDEESLKFYDTAVLRTLECILRDDPMNRPATPDTLAEACSDIAYSLTVNRYLRIQLLTEEIGVEAGEEEAPKSPTIKTVKKAMEPKKTPVWAKLYGSERQITWAEKIRADIIAGIAGRSSSEMIAWLCAQEESGWWIGVRELGITALTAKFEADDGGRPAPKPQQRTFSSSRSSLDRSAMEPDDDSDVPF